VRPEGKYNYGLFGQEIGGQEITWAYGQYDCYSSLFIQVPGKGLTLVMAANNNLMSDPARLIYGDVTSSLFASWFFRNFLDADLPIEQLKAQGPIAAKHFCVKYSRATIIIA